MNYKLALLLFLIATFQSMGQIPIDSLNSEFLNNVEVPEENVYIHLNKSLFIAGEDIAFTTYVIDQKRKAPSIYTKNLYCQLIDKNDKVVK